MKYISSIVFCLFICGNALAATYYVDFNSGDNSNDGSISNPWKEAPGTQNPVDTPTDGWTSIAAGDTLIFTGGQTWTRGIRIAAATGYANPTNEAGRITFTTSDQDITNRAVIDLTGVDFQYGIKIDGIDFVQVEYFEVTVPSYTGSNGNGIWCNSCDEMKVYYNYSHDIDNGNNADSYAFTCNDGSGGEIAYNIFEDANQKIVECFRHNDGIFHHNLVQANSDFSGDLDHLMVVTQSSSGWSIYSNIFILYKNFATDPFAGFKFDGTAGGTKPDGNKLYNNIFIGTPQCIALIDAGTTNGNEIIGNTCYGQDNQWSSGAYGLNGITLCYQNQGTECANNKIKNNIIYEIGTNTTSPSGNMACMLVGPPSTDISGNEIENNLCYHESASNIRFFVFGTGAQTEAEMESNWHGSNSNVFQNNVVGSDPAFSGGADPVSNLPTGFTSGFLPNNTGLQLTGSSSAVDSGVTLSSPYNVDILGSARSGFWDLGAYELIAGIAFLGNPVSPSLSGSAPTTLGNPTSPSLSGSGPALLGNPTTPSLSGTTPTFLSSPTAPELN